MQVNIRNLIDDVQCYQTVRDLRWPDGIACPSCQSKEVIKRGFDDKELARQRYECHDGDQRFDAPGSSIFKVVQKKWCTAWCRALQKSPKPRESAVGAGSEPSYVDRSVEAS